MHNLHCCYAPKAILKSPAAAYLTPRTEEDRTKQRRTRSTMNLIRNYRNWRRYRDTVSELSRLSNRELTDLGIARSDIRLRRPQVDLRNFARVDLLPDPDGYGQRSPPPDRWPSKRRPPHLLPRRALFPKKASPLRKQAKGISSKPTSSPAMTNRPVPHLLPRTGHKNDTRRISSPGGCCVFGNRRRVCRVSPARRSRTARAPSTAHRERCRARRRSACTRNRPPISCRPDR